MPVYYQLVRTMDYTMYQGGGGGGGCTLATTQVFLLWIFDVVDSV